MQGKSSRHTKGFEFGKQAKHLCGDLTSFFIMTKLESFLEQKYLSLETYRKSGKPVRTPVWFVIFDDLIYVVTREKTGKVKRIKNNHNVKISPCTFIGKPIGEWVLGKANFVKNDEAQKAIQLRTKKHGIFAKFANFVTSQKGNLIVISIKLE